MKAPYKYLHSGFFFLFSLQLCWAQVDFEFSQPLNVSSAQQLLDGKIRSRLSGRQLVRVIGRLELNDEVAWEGKTNPFDLDTPSGEVNLQRLFWVESDDFQALATGNYRYCLIVISEASGREINRYYASCRVLAKDADAIETERSKGAGKNGWIQSRGSATITGQLANQNNPFSLTPANYARVNVRQSVSLFGMPFNGQLFYTTEDRNWDYNLSNISLQFDPATLLQQAQSQGFDQLQSQLQSGDSTLYKQLSYIKDQRYQAYASRLMEGQNLDLDSLLSAQVGRQELLGRIEKMMNQPSFQDTPLDWERELQKYGLDPKSNFGRLEDSLLHADSSAYASFVGTKAKYDHYQGLLSRYEELSQQQDSSSLNELSEAEVRQLSELENEEPAALLQEPGVLKKLGIISKEKARLLEIERFDVGNLSPMLSQGMSNGTLLRGLQVAASPHDIYIGGMMGSPQMGAFWTADSFRQVNWPKSIVSALKLGYGLSGQNFLHATYLKGTQGSKVDEESPGALNHLVGLEGGFNLLQNQLRFHGEFNYSILDVVEQDTLQWEHQVSEEQQTLPTPILPESGHGSYLAMDAQGSFFQGSSSVYASVRRISEGYYSMAAPYQIRGQTLINARYNQTLWDRSIMVSGFYNRDHNPLLPNRLTQVITSSYGLMAQFQKSGYPIVSTQWMPFYQEVLGEDSEVEQDTRRSLVNANLQYGYSIAGLQASTMLGYSGQFARETNIVSDDSSYYSSAIAFSQNLTLPTGGSLGIDLNYVEAAYSDYYNEILQLSGYYRTTFFGKWQNTASLVYEQEKQIGRQIGIEWFSRIPIYKGINWDTRLSYARLFFFDGVEEQRAFLPNQLQIQSSLVFQW